MTRNWLNDTSRNLNGKIYSKRLKLPSIIQRNKWHEEFVKLGLDKKQSFLSYLKWKTKEWHLNKRNKKLLTT